MCQRRQLLLENLSDGSIVIFGEDRKIKVKGDLIRTRTGYLRFVNDSTILVKGQDLLVRDLTKIVDVTDLEKVRGIINLSSGIILTTVGGLLIYGMVANVEELSMLVVLFLVPAAPAIIFGIRNIYKGAKTLLGAPKYTTKHWNFKVISIK